MEYRFFMVAFTCDAGQGFPWDYPPCEANETQMQTPFELPYEFNRTFDGFGVMSGSQLFNLEDRSFTTTAHGLFMGEVEGCGYGTVFLNLDDGAGYIGEDAIHYTAGTAEILPGGTLPLAGSIDLIGVQVDHPDGTASVEVSGSYFCEGADD